MEYSDDVWMDVNIKDIQTSLIGVYFRLMGRQKRIADSGSYRLLSVSAKQLLKIGNDINKFLVTYPG